MSFGFAVRIEAVRGRGTGQGICGAGGRQSEYRPMQYVDPVVALAKENGIPAQYGVTGVGNDGSGFFQYGSGVCGAVVAITLFVFPSEVIDTTDLDALRGPVARKQSRQSVAGCAHLMRFPKRARR